MRYRILRNGQALDVAVPTMTFGLRDWLLSFGVYIAIGVAFLVMGTAPYMFRAATPVALPLCFMVLTVFVWFQTTFDFMTEAVLPKELRIFALTLTPSAAIHLALMLSRSEAQPMLRPRFVAVLYGVGLALGAMNSLTFFGPLEIGCNISARVTLCLHVGAVFSRFSRRALGKVHRISNARGYG